MSTGTRQISRRAVLGMAVAGGAGAVAIRFLGFPSASSLISAAGPDGAWSSPLGSQRGLAAHLLRRAGFGYTDAELEAASQLSYDDLVEQLLTTPAEPLPLPSDVTNYASVAQTWLAHMATTKSQMAERMTLFWHGHLTSDYRKAARFPFVYTQNVTYRENALGDLRTLLVRATSDPLMMRYLDLDQSTGSAPNENFSRELMELYTLGVNNYTEDDVKAAAKGLSGLRVMLIDASGNVQPLPRPAAGADKQAALTAYYKQLAGLVTSGSRFSGVLEPGLHYDQPVTFLGKTATFEPTDVIDQILAQPAVAPFIATKALTYFAVPQPSSSLVNSVASDFRSSNYDIKTLMRSIFRSDDFKAASNYRSLVRSPVDYVVAVMRVLGRPDLAKAAFTACAAMDQTLYDMPTVAGWPVNGAWLSSGPLLARVNAAAQTVETVSTLPDPHTTGIQNQLDGVAGPDLAAVYNASHSDQDRWYAIFASPEFQLK